ncbi:efflux RND transporter periplasmic adaptor subunit [soil metagenome]
MLAIVAIGILIGAALLLTGKSPTGHEDGAESSHSDHADEDKDHDKATLVPAGKENAAETIRLSAAQLEAAGIRVQAVGPGTLKPSAPFQGEIRFNDDKTAHVVPRVAGVVDSVRATLGQQVRQGEVLAILSSTSISELRSELQSAQRRAALARTTYERERGLWEARISPEQDLLQAQAALQESEIAVHNAAQKLKALGAASTASSLSSYELRAPFAGSITEKHLTLGESVKEDAPAFVLSDLSTVWAEFVVAPGDLAAVRVGQKVTVTSSALTGSVEATVSYVGPLLGEQTRTARARATLVNPDAAWRPGLFVTVSVAAAPVPVAVAIPADAVQTVEDKPSVFVAIADGFELRHLKTGRSDSTTVEVLEGLRPGESIAVSNTFVIKSELGKAGAEHSH